jgi:IS30 family transposase
MEARVYKRLSVEEREEISRSLARGETFKRIGERIGRVTSTISREVDKGSGTRWSYRAGRAQRRANRNARKRRAGKRKIIENEALRVYVEEKLRLKWSPEQIAKRIKIKYPLDMDMRISHEAVYAHVYVLPKGSLKKELLKCFRRSHKRRYRSRKDVQSKPLRDMVSIDERPPDVESREITGHWEGDLIIGRNRQSALGTLTERKSRFALLVKVRDKSAQEIRKRFARKLKQLPKHARLSMTYDQGREMAEHAIFTKETDIQVYFAHKGCPWERGTNENFNGLVRQFFPKGTDFNAVSDYQINKVQDLLNGRPRKVLDFQTPFEVFEQNVALNP